MSKPKKMLKILPLPHSRVFFFPEKLSFRDSSWLFVTWVALLKHSREVAVLAPPVGFKLYHIMYTICNQWQDLFHTTHRLSFTTPCIAKPEPTSASSNRVATSAEDFEKMEVWKVWKAMEGGVVWQYLRRSGASCNVGRILKCWNFNLGCHLLVSSWYRLAINGKNCHVSRLWNITQPIHWASHFQEADVICVHSINPHKLRLPLSARLLLTSAEDLKDLRSSKSGKAMEGGGFATYWRSWSCVQEL